MGRTNRILSRALDGDENVRGARRFTITFLWQVNQQARLNALLVLFAY